MPVQVIGRPIEEEVDRTIHSPPSLKSEMTQMCGCTVGKISAQYRSNIIMCPVSNLFFSLVLMNLFYYNIYVYFHISLVDLKLILKEIVIFISKNCNILFPTYIKKIVICSGKSFTCIWFFSITVGVQINLFFQLQIYYIRSIYIRWKIIVFYNKKLIRTFKLKSII